MEKEEVGTRQFDFRFNTFGENLSLKIQLIKKTLL
jgi:hypothetical protein